jgi:endonuclease G
MVLQEALIASSAHRFRDYEVNQAKRTLQKGRRTYISKSELQRRREHIANATGNPRYASKLLERIIDGNDLVGVNYLAQGMQAARSVGRISLRDDAGRTVGYGTGFLVAPGVVMTNNHVIGSDVEGAGAVIDFDYEQDEHFRDREVHTFRLAPGRCFITDERLDFTLIGVEPEAEGNTRSLSDIPWLRLKATPGKAFKGEYLTIIQHPGGERKQVCVRENKLLRYAEHTVWYETDTLGGSSGAPVFNNLWEVVALHHSGIPATDRQGRWLTVDGKVWDRSMDETKIKWVANEGIRVSSILAFLQDRYAADPGARAVIDVEHAPHPHEADRHANGHANGMRLRRDGNALELELPLRFRVQFGADLERPQQKPQPPARISAQPLLAIPDMRVEKVEIDQSDLLDRPGYRPDFIGTGKLAVPLPVPDKRARAEALTFGDCRKAEMPPRMNGHKADEPYVLDYFNYSVLLNKARRLAFYSAVNIDGGKRRDTGKREGDKWFDDPRVPAKFYLGQSFYSGKVQEEAARKTPFDRGHLVRRLDATWGATEAIAKRHGDDTFHFPNCTPQHLVFNQGKQKGNRMWQGLEDYVLQKIESERRVACVFNGPVFGKSDGRFLNFRIPAAYWKLMVIAKGRKLSAAAFLLAQSDLIRGVVTAEAVTFRPLTEDQIEAAQIPITKLEALTGLSFGPLSKFDALDEVRDRESLRRRGALESYADVMI